MKAPGTLTFHRALPLVALILLLTGCTPLQDFLNMSAPEVQSYLPKGQQLELAPEAPVRVRFSQAMNAARTEAAFTLERDGTPQSGRFAWTGRELVFIPDSPFMKGYRYLIRVRTEAEDLHGNSLAQEFAAVFSTADWGRLTRIVAHFPPDNAVINDPRTELRVEFDSPVERSRLLKEFRIAPEIQGELLLSDHDRILQFIPHEDWRPGRYYTVELGSTPEQRSGAHAIEHLMFGFSRASELMPTTATVVFEPSGVVAEPTPALIRGVEVQDDIVIQFDVPVPTAEQQRILSLPAGAAGTLRWSEAADSVRISSLRFVYEQLYELQVNGLRYAFVVDGSRYRPPEVVALRYRPDELSPAVLLEPYGALVLAAGAGGSFSFDLLHAPDTSLDPGKLIEALSFEVSTGAGSITVQSVSLSEAIVSGDGNSATSTLGVGVQADLSGEPGLLRILVRESIADLRGTSAVADFVRRVNF